MNQTLTAKLTRTLAVGIGVVLLLLPFHAFLTVWLSSAVGHYTLLRLWKECLLLAIGLVALSLLARDAGMRKALRQQQLFWLIGLYLLLQFFLGVTSLMHQQVSGKALAYGLLDDTRYLFFLILCAGITARDDWLRQHWRPLVLTPAALVVGFGLLQVLVLPPAFLQHFGYSSATIPAVETVNSNIHYVRVQSTLRGANPLGAYLVLIIAVLGVSYLRSKTTRARLAYSIASLATFIVLYFSYSRSAWIGAALSLVCLLVAAATTKRAKRGLAVGLVVVIAVALIGG